MKLYKKKVISRQDGKPYLVRYSLFACRFFAVKIHHILISDAACMHDHPWAFISILLRGSYYEQRQIMTPIMDGIAHYSHEVTKRYSAGSILYRPAQSIHRLVISKPVWSLVITFKKVRPWGFITKSGWVPWHKYNEQNTCE